MAHVVSSLYPTLKLSILITSLDDKIIPFKHASQIMIVTLSIIIVTLSIMIVTLSIMIVTLSIMIVTLSIMIVTLSIMIVTLSILIITLNIMIFTSTIIMSTLYYKIGQVSLNINTSFLKFQLEIKSACFNNDCFVLDYI